MSIFKKLKNSMVFAIILCVFCKKDGKHNDFAMILIRCWSDFHHNLWKPSVFPIFLWFRCMQNDTSKLESVKNTMKMTSKNHQCHKHDVKWQFFVQAYQKHFVKWHFAFLKRQKTYKIPLWNLKVLKTCWKWHQQFTTVTNRMQNDISFGKHIKNTLWNDTLPFEMS